MHDGDQRTMERLLASVAYSESRASSVGESTSCDGGVGIDGWRGALMGIEGGGAVVGIVVVGWLVS